MASVILAAGDGAVERRRRILAIVGGASGNLVEWYDFFVYSFMSLYFAPAFFPNGDRTTQLLNAAGIFAAGFLMRPLGGWFFGRISDRQGRRRSMIIAVLMMCGGSLMVAMLPTYSRIGAAAPALLLLARLVQGLSVGGEYGSSATYMSEIAIAGHRGFYASFHHVTVIGGQLLALVVLVALQQVLSVAELRAWGWRVPFAVGAAAAVVALVLRRGLPETSAPATRLKEDAGTIRGVLRHPRSVITVLGFAAGASLSFHTSTTYMQKYLVNTAGLDGNTASQVMTAALFCFMVLQPIFGAISDRIGRRASLLCYGALGTVTTVPLMTALGHVKSSVAAFSLVLASLAVVSFYTSVAGLVKAELFPGEVRAMGVGLTHAIATAFGGSAEYIALSLKAAGREWMFSWYITALCAVAFISASTLKGARWSKLP